LYGYWSHCLYSCDAQSYDAYMKSGKQLPMVQLDQHFNAIDSEQNRQLLSGSAQIGTHSHADLASLAGKDNGVKFSLSAVNGESDSNIENNENLVRKSGAEANGKLKTGLTSAASSPAFSSLAIKHSLNDLVELWRVVPKPTYTADVSQKRMKTSSIISILSMLVLNHYCFWL
jgi:hypothetical protein